MTDLQQQRQAPFGGSKEGQLDGRRQAGTRGGRRQRIGCEAPLEGEPHARGGSEADRGQLARE